MLRHSVALECRLYQLDAGTDFQVLSCNGRVGVLSRVLPIGDELSDSGSCDLMSPEIAELVELLARAAYQRWRAGKLLPDAAFPQADHVQNNQLPNVGLVAYDHPGPTLTRELLGCASTPMPDTARTDKQKPR